MGMFISRIRSDPMALSEEVKGKLSAERACSSSDGVDVSVAQARSSPGNALLR